jgi:mannobiose 2-epimerase
MLNKSEFKDHLLNGLLPFWNNLYDGECGGFYNYVDGNNKINKNAPKTAVVQPRILWFYSSCYKLLKEEYMLNYAKRQFDFIRKYMLDPADGAICWEVGRDGRVKDGRKHAYAQAFALYAFSAYYTASKDEEALGCAGRLFDLIENKFKNEYGYPESFIIDVHEFKYNYTMNTLLHIIEAYTEYYLAVKSEKARKALEYSLNLVINKAYSEKLRRIECYFDEFMDPVGNMHSYGHDIESSWLIHRACEALGNDAITNDLAPKLEKVARHVISKGFINEGRNGIYYDNKNGADNKLFEWWVSAEAIVALVHQYNLYRSDKSAALAENLWEYVKAYFISPHGEWYWRITEEKQPVENVILCGPWKCPYHNGRMCLEMIKILR